MLGYTWARLPDGSWGVAGEGGTPGTQVTVYRKDGTSSVVVLGTTAGTAYGKTLYRVASQQKSKGGSSYRGGGETKRCWECGRSFTYRECKEQDGEWQDSYCGC